MLAPKQRYDVAYSEMLLLNSVMLKLPAVPGAGINVICGKKSGPMT